MTHHVLTPAYGRRYTTAEEVEADFMHGLDFVHNAPRRRQYCSIRDFDEGDTVELRFDHGRMTVITLITLDEMPTESWLERNPG